MLQKPHTDTMCRLEQDLNLQFVIEKEEKKTQNQNPSATLCNFPQSG